MLKKLRFCLISVLFFSFRGFFFSVFVDLVRYIIGFSKALTLSLFLEEYLQRCWFTKENSSLAHPKKQVKGKKVLLVTAQNENWCTHIKEQLLKDGLASLKQGFIRPISSELNQEEEFNFFSQGIDWQVEHFPSSEIFDCIVISPALAYLGHRAMFLRWLSKRYNCKQFIVQLPAFQQSVYQHIRLYRGLYLASRDHRDKILYQRESLELDFGLWYNLDRIVLLKEQALYQIVLQEKVPQKKEYSSPLFSIIVPIYNVERYLRNCLDSILKQTFSSFEVILVNDVSPDNSQKIIDSYTAKDKRFHALIHKYNQGLGSTRNTGIKAATARYLLFLDSDDFLHPACLETLAYLLEKSTLQGVGFNIYRSNFSQVIDGNCYTRKSCLQLGGAFSNSYYYDSAWSKVYKREQNPLLFPQKVFYEDVIFSSIMSLRTKQFIFAPLNLYYYRINQKSITQRTLSWKHIEDRFIMLRNIANFFTNKLACTLSLEILHGNFHFAYQNIQKLCPEQRQAYSLNMWKLPRMNYQQWLSHKKLKNDFQKISKILERDEKQAFHCLEKIYKKIKFYATRQLQWRRDPLFELFDEQPEKIE